MTSQPGVITLTSSAGGESVSVGTGDITLMGVINRSPESANKDVFADSPEAALRLAERFTEYGVQVIDIGGQSTNYENPRITEEEELERVIPTVMALAQAGFIVSVDTFRPLVGAEAIAVGASLLNDTAGLVDPAMVRTAADSDAPAVLMHLEGDDPLEVGTYDDANGKPDRIATTLAQRIAELAEAGVTQVIVDPGTGISYRSDYDRHSQAQFEIAEDLAPLIDLGAPVMYAVPRKADRYRNVALATLAMAAGAAMLRIHDIEMISDVAWLMRRLKTKPGGPR